MKTVLSFVLLCVAVDASAQATGRVSGRVVDQTGAVLPGVTIDLVVDSRELTTTTDDAGNYGFADVPAGSAELTYRLLNFTVHRSPARSIASSRPVSPSNLSASCSAASGFAISVRVR
jgi:hypothetical protein